MKKFKKLLAVIIVFLLVCLQIPMGVFASSSIEWSDTNLAEGQADIVLNDYTARWLEPTLATDGIYKVNFNIVASATEGYRLTTLGLRDSKLDGASGLYIVFNAATDQIRVGYEATTNSSLIAVASEAGITAAGTYAIEVISYPDAIEIFVNGNAVSLYDFADGQMKTKLATNTFADGKIGYLAQGNVLDAQITDIAVYGEAGVEIPNEPEEGIEWSDTNLVEGQGSITLDYFWKWMPATIKGDASYKYKFNIQATETAGYRFPTVAVRDVSAASNGSDGLYVVFNNSDDQIRIGYEYTTNTSLIAVATGVGFSPAGTYEVEIITTPTTIEVYMNGNKISFYDFNLGQYNVSTITTKEFADAKAGFITQGNVMDTQITDIAIYGEEGVEIPNEPEEGIEWSDINMVEGQETLTLDYFWKWMPANIKGNESYKYSFDIIASETEGYRLPTVAVRDVSANSDGSDGLYVVFNNAEDQIRIGYEYTTNSSLIAVAMGVGFSPAGTYEVEIITTPTTIEVYMNGNKISFYDFNLGQYNVSTITTKEFADAKAGFITQGNVMDTQITDIAFYTEAGKEVTAAVGDVNNDGNINNKDLGLLMQYINGWDITIDETTADVNVDGKINNKDYGLLMQYLNNWDVELG